MTQQQQRANSINMMNELLFQNKNQELIDSILGKKRMRVQKPLNRMLSVVEDPILETPEQFRTRTTQLILPVEPLTYAALKNKLAR